MMHRIDLWIGKTLFVPIAIRLCQQFKITQYALHAYIWAIVWLTWVWESSQKLTDGWTWAWFILVTIIATFNVAAAALNPDMLRVSRTFVRYMWLLLISFWIITFPVLVSHNSVPENVAYMVRDWFILLAEYAITITTIPPLESKEKKMSGKMTRQRI